MNFIERRRQRVLARSRLSLGPLQIQNLLVEMGISPQLADFVWHEFLPYYFNPLNPDPSDHLYGDLRIDPDDVSDIALRFEKLLGTWLGEVPIACPADPTIAEFAMALQNVLGESGAGR